MPSHTLFAVALGAALLASSSASAQQIVVAPPSPIADAAPTGGAGLFVGVNEFSDPSGKVGNLRFAVNDAVELAHLFALELRLIPAANCTLALSGEPEGETAKAHLAALKAAGATVTTAKAVAILDALDAVSRRGRTESDLLIIGCSSHGFSEGERAYLMPQDGRFAFLDRTAVPLETLEGTVRRSKAGHRLLLIDACQDRVSATRGLGGRQAATAMSNTFAAALAKPTGQAKLASCEVGQFSLELPSLQQGVFTAALLDSLRGGASDADGDGFVRLAEVQTATTARVSSLIADYNRDLPEADHIRQSPTYHGPEATRALPLAVPATDVAILIEKLARRIGQQGYTRELHARLADVLNDRTAPADLRREAERFADRGGRFFASIATVELGGAMAPGPLVVAADGSGDHRTIQAALEAAAEGARVTVRPGLYRENGLTIDRAVTLEGVGPREQVVIEASETDALHLKAPVATVKGLTLRCTAAPEAKMTGLWISAGTPLVEDCVATSSSIASIYVAGDGTAPTLRNCRAENGASYGLYILEKAAGAYDNCVFAGHADDGVAVKDAGTNPILRGCRAENGAADGFVVFDQAGGTFENCTSAGNAVDGIAVRGPGTAPTFRGCLAEDAGQDGFFIHKAAGGTFERCVAVRAKNSGAYILDAGTEPTFREFRAENCTRGGLLVRDAAAGTYDDCTFIDNGTAGIGVIEGADPTVKRCRVKGSDIGLFVVSARGTYEDGVFTDAKTHGLHIGRAGAKPTLRRCRCENAKGNGLLVNEGGSGVFEDCTLTGSGQAGIQISGRGTDAVIRGGASTGNAWQGVGVDDRARATVSNVDLRNNRRGAWFIEASAGPVTRTGNKE
ncbi:right-handed parallel beta-helix repeat-containing protein [Alienimonas chondri]|uniref:Right handed beta helix domain-containing protein n=1 Tax=Alienimonas chondri TaxID=2681879 RepID=A0ABX1VI43_9PLAN|nr:right-handed parallel beta-helix repeat-containing protein [Alienimonas chondri]NNJ27745.1 hypothetical protein [Alienimonas chondri]